MKDVDDDMLPVTKMFLSAVGVTMDEEEQQTIEEAEADVWADSAHWGRRKRLQREIHRERRQADLEVDLLEERQSTLHVIKPTPPLGRTPFSYDNKEDYSLQSRRHMLQILQDDQEFNRRRQAVTA